MLKKREEELIEIKKNIRYTKVIELEIQLKTCFEEIKKLRNPDINLSELQGEKELLKNSLLIKSKELEEVKNLLNFKIEDSNLKSNEILNYKADIEKLTAKLKDLQELQEKTNKMFIENENYTKIIESQIETSKETVRKPSKNNGNSNCLKSKVNSDQKTSKSHEIIIPNNRKKSSIERLSSLELSSNVLNNNYPSKGTVSDLETIPEIKIQEFHKESNSRLTSKNSLNKNEETTTIIHNNKSPSVEILSERDASQKGLISLNKPAFLEENNIELKKSQTNTSQVEQLLDDPDLKSSYKEQCK